MKRSQKIVLVLTGTLSSASFIGCDQSPKSVVNENTSYTNNQHVAGGGYYHAPYHSWFPMPYNHFDPARGYFHGGTWSQQPNDSPVNVSRPTSSSVQMVNRMASGSSSSSKSSTTTRSGFGRSSHSSISS